MYQTFVIFPAYFDQIIYLYLSACDLDRNHSYNINTHTTKTMLIFDVKNIFLHT